MPFDPALERLLATRNPADVASSALRNFHPDEATSVAYASANFLVQRPDLLSSDQGAVLQERLRNSPRLATLYDHALCHCRLSGFQVIDVREERSSSDEARDALDRFLLPGELDHPNRVEAARDLFRSRQNLSIDDRTRLEYELSNRRELRALYERAREDVGDPNALRDLNPAALRNPHATIHTIRRSPPNPTAFRAASAEEPIPPRIIDAASARQESQEWQLATALPTFRVPPTLSREEAFIIHSDDESATPGRRSPDRQQDGRQRDRGGREG